MGDQVQVTATYVWNRELEAAYLKLTMFWRVFTCHLYGPFPKHSCQLWQRAELEGNTTTVDFRALELPSASRRAANARFPLQKHSAGTSGLLC